MRIWIDRLGAWWDRLADVTGARVIAVAWAAAFAALAAFGGSVGAPSWLRILAGALAALGLVVAASLQWREARLRGRPWRRAAQLAKIEHFGPKGRGVSTSQEPGQYFTGRVQALRELVRWLEHPSRTGARGYLITGDPGSGKSAVPGRLVRLSDPMLRRQSLVEQAPQATVPPQGVIDLIMHVHAKTLADVVSELARGLAVRVHLPDTDDPKLWEDARRELLAAVARRKRRSVVVVDAVDEAQGEGEARRIAQQLLKPLVAGGRVHLLVGTRRGAHGELLRALGSGYRVIDLDTQPYLEVADLVEYARRQLLREQEPDEPTPYRERPQLTDQVARAIGQRALPSFLVCQLASRRRALEGKPVDTTRSGWEREFPDNVGDAMEDYLDLFETEQQRRSARNLLSGLAFAEGPGLPRDELWPFLAGRLTDRDYTVQDVDWLLDSRAFDLVHEVEDADGKPCYRLFHQALIDHLRASADRGWCGEPRGAREPRPSDTFERQMQRRCAEALEQWVCERDQGDWSRTLPYIKAHVAIHAAAGGVLDDLIQDPGYLLAAERTQLLRAFRIATATSPAGASARHAYMLAAEFQRSGASAERAAYLELAARQTGAIELANRAAELQPTRPWATRWAHWRPPSPSAIAGRHDGSVRAVALGELDGRAIAVSGGDDGTVRVWDLAAGTALGAPLTGHTGHVQAVAVGELDGRAIAVSGGDDGTVRVWDLAAGEQLTTLRHDGWVWAVALGELGGRAIAVSAGYDGTVRVWDLAAGEQLTTLTGHDGGVMAVAVGELDGRAIAVSGGDDGTVRVWDLAAGTALGAQLTGHTGHVQAVALGELGGRAIAVSAGYDGTVRVWDLAAGEQLTTLRHDGGVMAVGVGELDGRAIAVSGGDDGNGAGVGLGRRHRARRPADRPHRPGRGGGGGRARRPRDRRLRRRRRHGAGVGPGRPRAAHHAYRPRRLGDGGGGGRARRPRDRRLRRRRRHGAGVGLGRRHRARRPADRPHRPGRGGGGGRARWPRDRRLRRQGPNRAGVGPGGRGAVRHQCRVDGASRCNAGRFECGRSGRGPRGDSGEGGGLSQLNGRCRGRRSNRVAKGSVSQEKAAALRPTARWAALRTSAGAIAALTQVTLEALPQVA